MIRSRIGLKALGLCVLALCTMGVVAGTAQAEAGGEWLYEKKFLKEFSGGALELEVKGEVDTSSVPKDVSLLTKIIGKKVKFLCEEFKLIGVKLAVGGIILPGGRVLFHKCKTYIDEVESKSCEPYTLLEGGVKDAGLILSNKGKGLLALHEGATTTVIEPEVAGGSFGTIFMSELCAIGEEVPVFGKLVIGDNVLAEALEDKEVHLIKSVATLTKLYAISDTVEHLESSVDGFAKVSLAGAHAGKVWAGHAK